MAQFTWLTFANAKAALAARLADNGEVFWVDDELGRYLIEGLRTWNALTATWVTDYDFSLQVVANQIWYNLSSIVGYARQRTVTDTELYTLMEYHLLEPATGGTLAGTGQFLISDLSAALQRRRDEINQLTACNLANISLATTPNTRRTFLPDTVLEVERARFLPVLGSLATLWRNDDLASEYFQPGFLQNQAGPGHQQTPNPKQYGVITGPPLAFDVDITPSVPGTYDLVVLQSGPALAPPVDTILGLPDDFSWVAKWGALADLLGMESEATDAARADYCLARYRDGVTLLEKAPWIFMATINQVAVETVSVAEMDAYSVNWDSNPNARACIVHAGTDFISICPVPAANLPGVSLKVVGNAPIPLLAGDFVQVSRDTFDVMLDYAQHLAMFKQGGAEFVQSKELAKNFFLAAIAQNSRLSQLGLFRDLLLGQGQRQIQTQPRYEQKTAGTTE
jgi:hypothetical protein